jgi:cysteine synthase
MFDGATGSCADHTAEGILRFAAADGVLAKGMPVVEAGYGSFSLALALACRRLGHPLTLVMPATVAADRQQLLRGLGAAVATTNPLYGRDGQLRLARELAQEQEFLPLREREFLPSSQPPSLPWVLLPSREFLPFQGQQAPPLLLLPQVLQPPLPS